MTPDDKLAAFFAEASPPARDLGFQAAVAERVARRRAFATVGALIPWTIAAIVLCWAIGPMVEPVIDGLGRTLAPAAAILMLTGLGVVVLTASARRLTPI
ncbi:hypothetical protein [Brevundimonas sp. NIBR11]|uniref:hypothetical protein n=1 Tax=Brevundimonas sp. NIBR11 TaxID=3015999 RepID=UPI0022F12763|nr:hypothetical protein [Brevundimonas sp. NIBR11]WGM31254.1 hypothetical protein KKHFBJBL_01498 [Brevundimonas sp. NIBR11]